MNEARLSLNFEEYSSKNVRCLFFEFNQRGSVSCSFRDGCVDKFEKMVELFMERISDRNCHK